MNFRITITRAPLAVDFEAGSIGEAISILEQEGTALAKMFETGTALTGGTVVTGDAGETTETARRGRKPNKDKQPDPSTANAPDPLAIPAALARDPATNTSAAIPAAAPPPPPPPLAPPTPPSGVNAGKIIAALTLRATDDAAKTQLADWLAAYSLVRKGATYDEAISVVRMSTDEKLASLLQPLGIS